jgi:hypothetical protein
MKTTLSLALAFSFFSVATFAAVKETVLVSFDGENGSSPTSNLTLDSTGNIYGTTYDGGPLSQGDVFELTKSNGVWNETVLYTFCSLPSCADGAQPHSSLTLDSAGNLYGTTSDGGIRNSNCPNGLGGCGLVFELSPNSDGTWTETVLYNFTGSSDGQYPEAGLIFDSAGNLYGTAAYTSGAGGNPGVVFELSPTSGGIWNETVLYTFPGGSSGRIPATNLVFDKAGDLYGTTTTGGDQSGFCSDYGGCGVVFELTPTQSGPWQETVLHTFTGGADGAFPSEVTFSSDGASLLGTTSTGGNARCPKYGCGVAFELTPNSDGWTETVLYSFSGGSDGEYPIGNLTTGPSGNLYGVASGGGRNGKNVVAFELVPTRSGAWTERSLSLSSRVGTDPYAGFTLGTSGEVFGATSTGGSGDGGTVFELQ